ncbi:MAG: hypothetical protein K6G25_13895 [Bacteroidales bacterium]|nr:hypothetical protein [Bacteroidales bacterium]
MLKAKRPLSFEGGRFFVQFAQASLVAHHEVNRRVVMYSADERLFVGADAHYSDGMAVRLVRELGRLFYQKHLLSK